MGKKPSKRGVVSQELTALLQCKPTELLIPQNVGCTVEDRRFADAFGRENIDVKRCTEQLTVTKVLRRVSDTTAPSPTAAMHVMDFRLKEAQYDTVRKTIFNEKQ